MIISNCAIRSQTAEKKVGKNGQKLAEICRYESPKKKQWNIYSDFTNGLIDTNLTYMISISTRWVYPTYPTLQSS